jgi:hypothetical protein
METSSLKSVIPVFVFFLLLLLGWFTYGAVGFIKAIQTNSWSATSGTIVSVEVKKGTNSKGSTKFEPDISYSYTIGSEEYLSKKYSSTPARGTSTWAKEVISKYPINSVVTVSYNPKNTKDSVLDPGLQSDNYWMTILPLFFFVVVLLAFVKQINNRRNQPMAGTIK